MNDIVKTLFDLVKIDSPSGEEGEMGKYLIDTITNLGFKVKIDKSGQIFATSGVTNPLLITAHMDTVEPGKGIKPQIKNGFVQSDGNTILGADNKACIAELLDAIVEYKKEFEKLPPIEMLFSIKEETGGGIEYFPFEWIKAKRGITFDLAKPMGKIAIKAPYIFNFIVTYIGKTAHSSRPEEGINALNSAVLFINSVKSGRINSDTTVNIGKVNVGSGINTIPGIAVVEGEVRSCNLKTFNRILKEIKVTSTKISKKFKTKIKYELNGYCPGYEYSKNMDFIEKVAKVMKLAGCKTEFYSSTGVSDTNIIASKNIEFLCLSDGVEFPHTTRERISIKNLLCLKKLIFEFFKNASVLTI